MTKLNKQLKDYINALPIVGFVTFFGGVYAAIMLLTADRPADWVPSYFYAKALGALGGYYYMAWKNPGARVTFNFDMSTFNENEKRLYSLVAKYRSKFIITLPLIIYLVADFSLGKMHASTNQPTIEGYLGFLGISAGLLLIITMGAKYLSAWINIKRNWKKEFGSK